MTTLTTASTPSLVTKLFLESVKLGPITQMYMAYRAAPYVFSGTAAFGAQQVAAAVDRGRPATVAISHITATMVKLGFVDTVAAITSACVRADRADAVVKVSYEMMLLAELEAATLITKQMVQRGDYEDAAVICRAMADHGHAVSVIICAQEFMEMIAKENLPEPLKVAKDHIDSAVAWVTGKDSEGGDSKDAASKIEPEARKAEAKEDDSEPKQPAEEKKGENTKSAPADLTTASIM